MGTDVKVTQQRYLLKEQFYFVVQKG